MNYIDSDYIIAHSRDTALVADTTSHALLCDLATIDVDCIAGYFVKNTDGRKFPRGEISEIEVPVAVKVATLS